MRLIYLRPLGENFSFGESQITEISVGYNQGELPSIEAHVMDWQKQ